MEAPPHALLIRTPTTLVDPVRLFHGAAVERGQWETLGHLERRRLLVRGRYAALRSPGVVSHRSAAALWGLPDVDRPDARLHLIDARVQRTHSGRGVVRHVAPLTPAETTTVDGVPVTSLVRTAVDVARTGSSAQGVAVFDHLLHRQLVTRDELEQVLGRLGGRRGVGRARDALAFADPLAESPGESISRVTARELRVRAPVLQQEFDTDVGRFRVDFWWPEHGVVGEFDGRAKYADHDALWDEKLREDALRRHPEVRAVARWTMREAVSPAALAHVLLRAGVPVLRAAGVTPRR